MTAPLRHAPFRWLLAGRTISTLGGAVAPIAIAFAVLDLTGSLRDLGLVVGARSLASVAFLLAGGVIADRFPRRPVMVVAGTLAAATQGLAAAAVLTGTATVPLLTVLAFVNGTVTAFTFPAAAVAIGTDAALLAGAGIIALAVVGMLASPDVRRLEHHATPADTSAVPG
jgi:MFS family permease